MNLRLIFLNLLIAGLLVSCSTAKKPLHFINGQPTTNAFVVNTAIPKLRFQDGKIIKPESSKSFSLFSPKKGAEALTKQSPVNPAVQKNPTTLTPQPVVVVVKPTIGQLLTYYVLVGLGVWWVYNKFFKGCLVSHPKKSLSPKDAPKAEAPVAKPVESPQISPPALPPTV
jgi:hypothetical protein